MDPTRFDDLDLTPTALKTITTTTFGSILGLAGIGTSFVRRLSTDSDWGSSITLEKEALLPGKDIRYAKEKLS